MAIFWPLGLFGIAAVGGLVMAIRILGGNAPPWALSLAHAGLGAAGIVTLFFALQGVDSMPLVVALGLLVAAALGGFFLASFHLRKKPHPKIGLIVHAAVAVTGFVTLAAVAFGVL